MSDVSAWNAAVLGHFAIGLPLAAIIYATGVQSRRDR